MRVCGSFSGSWCRDVDSTSLVHLRYAVRGDRIRMARAGGAPHEKSIGITSVATVLRWVLGDLTDCAMLYYLSTDCPCSTAPTYDTQGPQPDLKELRGPLVSQNNCDLSPK